MLGICTGVIAPCATAPEWWCQTFYCFIYCLPLWGGIVAVYSGWRVFRWYEYRQMGRSISTETLAMMVQSETAGKAATKCPE